MARSAVDAQEVGDQPARALLAIHPVAARPGIRHRARRARVALDRLDRMRVELAHEHPDVTEIEAHQIAALGAGDRRHIRVLADLAHGRPDAIDARRSGVAIAVGHEVAAPRLGPGTAVGDDDLPDYRPRVVAALLHHADQAVGDLVRALAQ